MNIYIIINEESWCRFVFCKGGIYMDLLTVREAAEETKMSLGWWRQRIFLKDVRVVKIGRRVFIPRSTIEDIIARSIVDPRPESKFANSRAHE